ncbi:MAG TPA: CpaD family pilus assembly lipoprotein [Sphingobium sp.]|nr:CpaD family pilus assembly lipoprotein [Sphingobium sp.]
MQSTKTLFRNAAGLLACALPLTLAALPAELGARTPKRVAERGVESAHQPQVARTDFVFDVAPGRDGALDSAEAARLKSWFDALGLRYGDRVTLAGNGTPGLAGVRDSVRDIVARYGLLTAGDAPLTAGAAPAGSLRVVVSRSTASVPGCPSWQDTSQSDLVGGQGDNYGCAMARNLAAMIADPQDLVQGRSTETDLRAATSSRAIKAYQEKAPTGSGGLQGASTGGN